MKAKDIKEGNKLIADFMQLGGFDDGRYGWLWNNPLKKNGSCFSLEYNSSWDWLMPVYKKLNDELKAIKKPITSRKYSEKDSHIEAMDADIRCCIWGVNIERTFHGIVETIKWYNENNKSKK